MSCDQSKKKNDSIEGLIWWNDKRTIWAENVRMNSKEKHSTERVQTHTNTQNENNPEPNNTELHYEFWNKAIEMKYQSFIVFRYIVLSFANQL